jgi:hypothetical protein
MLAVLVLMAIIGLSAAQPSEKISKSGYGTTNSISATQEQNTSFIFEQSVQGNGYFMTYMYAKAGNLAMKNYAHGSGSVDNDAILQTYEKKNQWHPIGTDWIDYNESCIQFKEDNAMVYAPMRIAVGNGYYAANPLDYSSLLKEKTWVKNYRAATSMHHEIEYAHAIDKELDLVAKEKFNHTYDPEWVGVGYTQMRVNEDVTDGKVHIGVLQGQNTNVVGEGDLTGQWSGLMSRTAWKKPSIEIDEDYWGTYHIEKNMTLEVPFKRVEKVDDWLPCCFGGYLTMPKYYQMGPKGYGSNVKGVFDCTCYKAPGQAQWPRVY